MPAALPARIGLARIVAQGLVPATHLADPVAVARHLLVVQGQQATSLPHALLVRTGDATGSDVRRAFEEGALARSRPMRGTVHVTAAEDHHWMRRTLHWVRPSSLRHDEEFGLTTSALDRAAEVALGLIEERGPVRRSELFEAWSRAGLDTHLDDTPVGNDNPSGMFAQTRRSRWRRRIIVRLDAEGVLVEGPMRGNEHLFLDARTLPSATSAAGGVATDGPGSDGHEHALAEVARRYVTSHGPVRLADLVRWADLRVGEARRALELAHEIANAADSPFPRLMCARVEAGGLVPLARIPKGREASEVLHLCADLLAENVRDARRTLFLPAFDELHVGYKDRSCLTDEEGERLICPSRNGMFRPLLVDRGRLVAVRPVAEGLLWGVKASARLARDVERAIRLQEERIAR